MNDLGVGTITFFHPASNSLPGAILRQLAEHITEAGERQDIRVLVMRSGGDRAFCAGASLIELVAISNEDEGLAFFSGFALVINAIRTCPAFVIGCVQGKTVGGGVGLAAAVDHCFATKFAAVKLSELAVGIGPFVVVACSGTEIGVSGMGTLAVDARTFKFAQWVADHGLYAQVFDSAEEMDEAVDCLAGELASSNPEAMTHLKRVLWQGTEHWDESPRNGQPFQADSFSAISRETPLRRSRHNDRAPLSGEKPQPLGRGLF